MAGWGSRLRPHTLTIPKPMLPVAGKPIVERLLDIFTQHPIDTIDKLGFCNS